jgi:carotenoid cleavage dioxygenase-like enzyme
LPLAPESPFVSRTTAFELGFRTVEREYTARRLPVEGTVPQWLSGRLIRNGPGAFEIGGERATHWFDGLAMLRGYAVDDGEVRYTNRFLRTEARERAARGSSAGEFATGAGPLREAARWLRALGPPTPTDNANVNVARIGDHYVAQTEAPRWIAFDPVTLETRGEFGWRDGIPGSLTTAHTKRDPRTGETVGFGVRFGRRPRYLLYTADADGRRRSIGAVPAAGPGYVHDLGLTRDYAVLVETPLRIDVWRALVPWSEGLLDMLRWNPDRGTRLLVVDRGTGDLVADPVIDPLFTFHTVNAFQRDGEVVLDLITFDDDAIVRSLTLSALTAEGFDAAPDGRLERVRLDPATDTVTGRTRRYDGGLELPTVPRDVRTRPSRYAYAQATDRAGANGLVKLDLDRATATEWWGDGLYVEEPRMVQRPDGDAEDDGVVLAPALDTGAERSVLLVFDAATLDLLARAPLPHAVPFGFHGRFFPTA